MVCVDSCKHTAISSKMDRDGHFYPIIDATKCVDCGLCTKSCPVLNGFDYTIQSSNKPLIAWSKDDRLRLKSSSGGIFAAIATHILNKGGVVAGCRMEGMRAKHVLIDNIDGLYLLQGSKYLHSDVSGIYNQIKNLLSDGRDVLFSGTRCQVAGLLSFLKKPHENLYTIDLVCTGVPSYNLLKKLEDKYISIASFRDKKQGWKNGYHQTFIQKDNESVRDTSNAVLYAKGFQNGLTTRYACYDCKFSKLHSKADLTLMDAWGDKEYIEQHSKGLSYVIPNSSKGLNLLKNSNVEMKESTWSKCLPHNPRLIYGKSFGMNHNIIRKIMPYAFEHFSHKTLLALYAGVFSMKNPFHVMIKFYKFLAWKIMTHDKKRYIHHALKNLK